MTHWRKLHPDVPLDVIGTDGVLDLQAGDADVAIRYGRTVPTDGIAEEFLRDTFLVVCSPKLRATAFRHAMDLRGHLLVHSYWAPTDTEAPTWVRWLAMAQSKWRRVPEAGDMEHLSFREELHAVEAVVAGQGVGIFSDVLVASELANGTLVKAFDLTLPGYRFHVVRRSDHPRERVIQAFSKWLHSVLDLRAIK